LSGRPPVARSASSSRRPPDRRALRQLGLVGADSLASLVTRLARPDEGSSCLSTEPLGRLAVPVARPVVSRGRPLRLDLDFRLSPILGISNRLARCGSERATSTTSSRACAPYGSSPQPRPPHPPPTTPLPTRPSTRSTRPPRPRRACASSRLEVGSTRRRSRRAYRRAERERAGHSLSTKAARTRPAQLSPRRSACPSTRVRERKLDETPSALHRRQLRDPLSLGPLLPPSRRPHQVRGRPRRARSASQNSLAGSWSVSRRKGRLASALPRRLVLRHSPPLVRPFRPQAPPHSDPPSSRRPSRPSLSPPFDLSLLELRPSTPLPLSSLSIPRPARTSARPTLPTRHPPTRPRSASPPTTTRPATATTTPSTRRTALGRGTTASATSTPPALRSARRRARAAGPSCTRRTDARRLSASTGTTTARRRELGRRVSPSCSSGNVRGARGGMRCAREEGRRRCGSGSTERRT